ncbi:MAG: hypothetical protein PHW43_00670, partial [Syntrophales bacterium]|nr:hypothetical protein [Syntrophales bacterium]
GAGILEDVAADIRRWSRIFKVLAERYAAQGAPEKSDRALEIFAAVSGTGKDRNSPLTPEEGKGAGGEADQISAPEEVGVISPDFRTVTLAELCIRQGHLEAAKAMLVEILARDEGNLKAAERLREVDAMLKKTSGKSKDVLRDLQGWLKKIEKAKNHGSDSFPPSR